MRSESRREDRWDVLLREYLTFRERTTLDEALEAARYVDAGVYEPLRDYRDGIKDTSHAQRYVTLIMRFHEQQRHNEFHTAIVWLAYTMLDELKLVEDRDPAELPVVFRAILLGCDRAIGSARALGDNALLAHCHFYRGSARALQLRHVLQDDPLAVQAALDDLRESARILRTVAAFDRRHNEALLTILRNIATVSIGFLDEQQPNTRRAVLATLDEAVAIGRSIAATQPAFREDVALLLISVIHIHLTATRDWAERQRVMPLVVEVAALGQALLEEHSEPGENPATASLISAFAGLALAADELGLPDAGLTPARLALELHDALSDADPEHGIYQQQIRTTLLTIYGWLLLDNEQEERAYEVLRDAASALERYFVALPDVRWQERLHDREHIVYDLLVRACLVLATRTVAGDERRRYEREAWETIGRSRARLTTRLYEAALDVAAVRATGTSREILHDLSEQRRLLLTCAATASTPGSDHETQQRADRINMRIETLWEQLAADDPGLAALQRVTAPDLELIQQLVRALPSGGCLLDMALVDDELIVFLLDGHTLHVIPIGVASTALEKAGLQFSTALKRGAAGGPVLEEALRWLASHLWPQLAPVLPVSDVGRDGAVPHLLIVPGPLYAWPLCAMPIPGSDERLIDRYACCVLPAADALVWLSSYEPAHAERFHALVPDADPSLPFALPLARYSAAILDADPQHAVFHGADATFTTLQSLRGGMIALATHAETDPTQPERSYVQLAEPGGTLESVWALEFLFGLSELRASLLFLLACEVHSGDTRAAGNWIGLSHAFLRAARSLVTSLWSIRDAVALAITVVVLDGLRAGLTIPQALRVAQRTVREADLAALAQMGARVSAVLPITERDTFEDAWADVIDVSPPPAAPLFSDPRWWAAFVVLGWPGTLEVSNLGHQG